MMGLGTLRMAVRPLLTSLTATKVKLFSPKMLLYTNTAISISLSVSGDVMQQWYQTSSKKKKAGWDQVRTKRVAVTGFVIGPIVHYWYVFLDAWLPGRTARVLLKKIVLDQVICSPIYLSVFMMTLGLMENRSWSEMKDLFREKGSVLVAADWLVWPPAQLVNFYYLPTKYRVLYDNSISLLFDCFGSYVWYEMEDEENSEESSNDKQLGAKEDEPQSVVT